MPACLLSVPIVGSLDSGRCRCGARIQAGEEPNVAVIYLGDASLEEGVYHESANFAALKKLPAIFVCENNLYSVYTNLEDRQPDRPLDRSRPRPWHADRPMSTATMSRAVNAAAVAAVARARAGDGPTFILADTYRWREHCGPNYDNDIGYRTSPNSRSGETAIRSRKLASRICSLVACSTRRQRTA